MAVGLWSTVISNSILTSAQQPCSPCSAQPQPYVPLPDYPLPNGQTHRHGHRSRVTSIRSDRPRVTIDPLNRLNSQTAKSSASRSDARCSRLANRSDLSPQLFSALPLGPHRVNLLIFVAICWQNSGIIAAVFF
uniref:Uncharacterized protein n=1 Tax=Kalanchoe fedtschenkoi TaxID=63787 RepID=A0A7N0U3K4_KALFE